MLIAEDQPAPGFEEGDALDGYRVLHALESRTRGEELYAVRAEDGTEATLVAGRQPLGNRRERARFRELAALRAELDHPAVLPVRTFGEADDRPYLITDEQPLRTFADLIEEEAPLEPERVVTMLAPVVEALDLGHERGLVHQALDPRSLLLLEGDRLVLDSYGLAGAGADGAWSEAAPDDLLYRSPEQLRNEGLGPAASVYSLATVLIHALTGEPPFGGGRTAITYGHLVEPAPRISERVDGLGTRIDRVLRQAMTKDPQERPDSTRALLSASAAALGTKTRPPAPPAPEPTVVLPLPEPVAAAPAVAAKERRAGRGALVAGVAVAAVCGVLLALLIDPFGGEDTARPAPAAGTAAWEGLADQRTELRQDLAGAETPQEQSTLAGSLAAAYDRAADATAPGPQAAAAHWAAAAYSDLAAAAEGNDEAAYAGAATAVGEAEDRVARVLRSTR